MTTDEYIVYQFYIISHYRPSKMQKKSRFWRFWQYYSCWNPVSIISTCCWRRAKTLVDTSPNTRRSESENPRKSDNWDLVLLCWPELWLSLVPALASRCLWLFYLISPIKLVHAFGSLRFWCRRSSLSSPGEAVSGAKMARLFRGKQTSSS